MFSSERGKNGYHKNQDGAQFLRRTFRFIKINESSRSVAEIFFTEADFYLIVGQFGSVAFVFYVVQVAQTFSRGMVYLT